MRKALSTHFLPSIKTKKRAKLLSHQTLFYYVLSLFAIFICIRVLPAKIPGILGYASNIKASDLLRYTNEQRAKNNLNELKPDSDLTKAAQDKADDMIKNNYWSHVSPAGLEPWHFFNLAGYDYSYAGENLAKNFNDSQAVVKAWMNSTSHRENMLNANYTDIGFAVVNGELQGYDTTLVVQFFGRRRVLIGEEVGSRGFSNQANKLSEVRSLSDADEVLAPPSQETVPLIDAFLFTKVVSIIFGLFILSLFAMDFWYSSKNSIAKLNGHTLAHIIILMMAVIGVGLVIIPGKIG